MSSKRKAAQTSTAAGLDGAGSHSAKRRKFSAPAHETPQSTTETGFRCLERLKNARDKKDWAIATHFMTLPDKNSIPQYYQQIGLPLALDTIEAKLRNHEYPTVTTLESDLRRMIGNAKLFNEKNSQIFSDAEKVRKAVSNFMVENNPAYQTGDYKPFPTPIPEDWQPSFPKEDQPEEDVKAENTHATRGLAARRASSVSTNALNGRGGSTPAVNDTEGVGEKFDGNSFQQAQEKIIAELINLKNDDGDLISGPFINLPSRDLREYYRVIKHPVSLKSVQKAVQGIKGRDKPTGVSLFKSWSAFDEETSCIWKNARHYNEDGSDISVAAGMLEDYFYRRLEEARGVVAEPPQQKVKLRMPAKTPDPPKITLKFGNPKPSGTAGVSIDNEALKRQQDLVNAGANSQASLRSSSRNPFAGSQSIPIPTLSRASQERARSGSSENPVVNGIKSEASHRPSPTPAPSQVIATKSEFVDTRPSSSAAAMPPPVAANVHLKSGSPYPQMLSTNHHIPSTGYSSTSQFDSSRRILGKEALISNLSITTHPSLKIDKNFHLVVPPSSSTTQQSITVTLPSNYYYLQIVPTIASTVLQRPYKIFVTVNNQRMNHLTQRTEDSDSRRPLYEARVVQGLNRIEVEMVAGPMKGLPKVGTGLELEMEKITVFAHLVKN